MEHGAAVEVVRLNAGWGPHARGGLGRANGAVSRNERSEELEIFVVCRSVDGVDKGESVDRPVGPVVVLEQRSRAYDFLKIPDVYSVALSNVIN
jgi:hypothetical protein